MKSIMDHKLRRWQIEWPDMDHRPGSGIYAIVHIATGMLYIGSSVDIFNRRRLHISKLNRGDHDNRRLQKSWDANGADAFQWKVLEEAEDCGLLRKMEQKWIDFHQSANIDKGFNLAGKAIKSKKIVQKLKDYPPHSYCPLSLDKAIDLDHLKKLRIAWSISVEICAEGSGLTVDEWTAIESGENFNISLETLLKMATALRVRPRELLR